ncbi:MAG: signal recognition particle-docking protein FtsY, partial [Pseudomonadota bacterium]
MAFFRKLKEKLFKSSSKLEEGLDAIVEDGGEEVEEIIADLPADPVSVENAPELPVDAEAEAVSLP